VDRPTFSLVPIAINRSISMELHKAMTRVSALTEPTSWKSRNLTFAINIPVYLPYRIFFQPCQATPQYCTTHPTRQTAFCRCTPKHYLVPCRYQFLQEAYLPLDQVWEYITPCAMVRRCQVMNTNTFLVRDLRERSPTQGNRKTFKYAHVM
jgi:hypothetical protein